MGMVKILQAVCPSVVGGVVRRFDSAIDPPVNQNGCWVCRRIILTRRAWPIRMLGLIRIQQIAIVSPPSEALARITFGWISARVQETTRPATMTINHRVPRDLLLNSHSDR
jgi:hypothetical protein